MSASEPKAGPSATPELALNSGVNKKAERIRARALAQPKPKVKTLPKAKPEPIPYRATSHPDEDEQAAVHEVYERIAPHFSQTRHKVSAVPTKSQIASAKRRLPEPIIRLGHELTLLAMAAHLHLLTLFTSELNRTGFRRWEWKIRANRKRSGSGYGSDGQKSGAIECCADSAGIWRVKGES